MADGGELVAGLLSGAQGYPMPAGRVRNLRIKCGTNALGANMTSTVYKNAASCNVIASESGDDVERKCRRKEKARV